MILIGDPAGDDAHPRKHEVDVVKHLSVEHLQRLAGLVRPALAEAQRQIAAARHLQRVARRRQIADFITAVVVGGGDARLAFQFRRGDADLRAAQRPAAIVADRSANRAADPRRPVRQRDALALWLRAADDGGNRSDVVLEFPVVAREAVKLARRRGVVSFPDQTLDDSRLRLRRDVALRRRTGEDLAIDANRAVEIADGILSVDTLLEELCRRLRRAWTRQHANNHDSGDDGPAEHGSRLPPAPATAPL